MNTEYLNTVGNEFKYKIGACIYGYIKKKHHIGIYTPKKQKKSIFRFANNTEMMFKGFDFIYFGIPVSITMNLKAKDRKVIVSNNEYPFGRVQFAIRYGNRMTEFDIPVLVIGFKVDTELTLDNIYDYAGTLKHYIRQIFELGIMLYEENLERAK